LSTLGLSIDITNDLNSNAVQVISRWIGCSNVVRNQKIQEFKNNIKENIAPSQGYSSIKSNENLSFLKDVPPQILRNSASKVFGDLEATKKGLRLFPKVKNKFKKRNCTITKELFFVEKLGDKSRICIYNHAKKRKSILFSIIVDVESDRISNQLILTRSGGRFSLSFSYNDDVVEINNEQMLEDYSHLSREELSLLVSGCDRGVARQIYTSNGLVLVYSMEEKEKLKRLNQKKARTQRYLAKLNRINEEKSKNKNRYKTKIAKIDKKIGNIRKNFSHHTSKSLVKDTTKILALEDLNLKNMTKKAKPKKEGRAFVKNNQSQKRGLNRAILNVNLGQILQFTKYKLNRDGKAWILVPPHNTSKIHYQCGGINTSRPKQDILICNDCQCKVDADENAALNIASRGIDNLIEKTFTKKKSRKKTVIRKKKKQEVVREPSLL
jgi:transposase